MGEIGGSEPPIPESQRTYLWTPKPMKNEGFRPPNMGEITPKNEGNMGSHGRQQKPISHGSDPIVLSLDRAFGASTKNRRKVSNTPWKINIIMEVWKIIFLSKRVICRFHVNFPGCKTIRAFWASTLGFLGVLSKYWFFLDVQKFDDPTKYSPEVFS